MRQLANGVLIAFAVGACVSDVLPPGISDAEVAGLGVQQGIAGRSAVRDGACMPGCLFQRCFVKRVSLRLRVLQPDPTMPLPTDASGLCALQSDTLGHVWGFPLPQNGAPLTVQEIDLSDKDEFAIPLDPGSYQVVLVDNAGCAYCLQSEVQAGVGICGRITVSPGEVVHQDVLLNVAGD